MNVESLDAQKGDHISSERLVSVLTGVEIDHFDLNDRVILRQMLTDIFVKHPEGNSMSDNRGT